MLKEGRIAGIGFWDIYHWTIAEVKEYLEVYNERRRRQGQQRVTELYQTVALLSSVFGSSEEADSTARMLINIYPQYWTEEEKDEVLQNYWTQKFIAEAERYNEWRKTTETNTYSKS